MPVNPGLRAVAVVIPARLGSRRVPGKPLRVLGGLPVIEHVRRRALAARGVARVVVATSDDAIARVVCAHGGQVVRTPTAPTGTHRVALAAASLPGCTHVINVQADQPLLNPSHIEAVVALLASGASIATLAVPMTPTDDPTDQNVVKVVVSAVGQALYFSRLPIPLGGPWLRHLGLYGFTTQALHRCAGAPPSALAMSEDLEQLRWLDHGAVIVVGQVAFAEPSLDTEEQFAAFARHFTPRHPSRSAASI